MEFFPSVNQQQTEENFKKTFESRDLAEIVAFRKQQAAAGTRSGQLSHNVLMKTYTFRLL
jgi:hypothetical protein